MRLAEADLHNYQGTSARHLFVNLFAGLLLDMGLGKTVSTLTAIKWLFDELAITSVLVIAPKRVARKVWSDELAKWSHLDGLKLSRVVGNERQRRAALAEPAHIYTIGRDSVAWLCGQYGGSMLPFDMLVIDESSSFKNHNTIRFKALKQVQPSFSRVAILTATPTPNSLIELWPQLFMLDRGERLGQTIGAYRREYFTPGAHKGHIVYKYELQKKAEERIHAAIADICISMKAEDYLELPGRVENIIEVDFPPALQQKYDDFEREQVLELLGEEDINVFNAAALSNKLLQFANGAVYDEEKNVHELHTLKLDALAEILESAQGHPVLVAWTYRHDLYRMRERFKDHNPRELKKDSDIDDWNAGEIPLLLMHPASGGHGLNLQAGGNIIVWFGQTWSSELWQQLNGRLDRQGQEEVTIIHRIVARKTLEEDVVKAVSKKEKNQDALMVAIKARKEKYF